MKSVWMFIVIFLLLLTACTNKDPLSQNKPNTKQPVDLWTKKKWLTSDQTNQDSHLISFYQHYNLELPSKSDRLNQIHQINQSLYYNLESNLHQAILNTQTSLEKTNKILSANPEIKIVGDDSFTKFNDSSLEIVTIHLHENNLAVFFQRNENAFSKLYYSETHNGKWKTKDVLIHEGDMQTTTFHGFKDGIAIVQKRKSFIYANVIPYASPTDFKSFVPLQPSATNDYFTLPSTQGVLLARGKYYLTSLESRLFEEYHPFAAKFEQPLFFHFSKGILLGSDIQLGLGMPNASLLYHDGTFLSNEKNERKYSTLRTSAIRSFQNFFIFTEVRKDLQNSTNILSFTDQQFNELDRIQLPFDFQDEKKAMHQFIHKNQIRLFYQDASSEGTKLLEYAVTINLPNSDAQERTERIH